MHQLQLAPDKMPTDGVTDCVHLIAMAIGTVNSQMRRDLICAVFGLLSLVGHMTELAEIEETMKPQKTPLPSSEMGYAALGVVFGPLLLGELPGDSYLGPSDGPSGRKAPPHRSPTKISEATLNGGGGSGRDLTGLQVHSANRVAQMMATHWRDVVCHMRTVGMYRVVRVLSSSEYDGPLKRSGKQRPLQPSKSLPHLSTRIWGKDHSLTVRKVDHHDATRPRTPELRRLGQVISVKRDNNTDKHHSNDCGPEVPGRRLVLLAECQMVD